MLLPDRLPVSFRNLRNLRHLRTTLLWLVGWTCTLAALIVVIAWCGGRLLSDRWNWSQWLLWIPTPAAILAAALGLAAAARPTLRPPRTESGRPARRRRAATWCAVLGLVLVYFLFVEHRFHRFGRSNGRGVRVVHWNVVNKQAGATQAFAEAIIREPADLLVISNAGPLLRRPAMAEAVGEGVTTRSIHPFTILSRLPIIEFRWLVANDGVYIALLTVDATALLGEPMTLLLVDLPRALDRARLDVAMQARALLDDAAAPPAHLVVGDLNMTRNGVALATLLPGYRHAFNQAGRGHGGTYPRRLPLYHIDHVLAAPGVNIESYDIIDPGVGRHRMQRVVVGRRR